MRKIGGNISPEREAAIKKTIEAFETAPTEPTEQCADGADHDFKGIMHTDSADSYTWLFKCEKCGEYVKITKERSAEDRAYWGD